MGEGGIRGGNEANTRRRLTVAQAAETLGVTVDAIRSRIKRGTIGHVREGGRVYVLLSADHDATSSDQGRDQGTAQQADQSPGAGPDDRDELLEELRDRVRYLEEANRENRRIIAGLVQRIPELEAPTEPRESPERPAERPEGAEPRPDTGDAQEVTRRPWWVRWFGG